VGSLHLTWVLAKTAMTRLSEAEPQPNAFEVADKNLQMTNDQWQMKNDKLHATSESSKSRIVHLFHSFHLSFVIGHWSL
jgi:glucokinase